MQNVFEIAERFAKGLDAQDYETARGLLSGECKYRCRGEEYVGPSAIIASYRENGDAAECKFDAVRYESAVGVLPDGTALIQYTDHLSRNGRHFTFQCEQVVEIGEDGLIARIEHHDLPGQQERLAAFMQK